MNKRGVCAFERNLLLRFFGLIAGFLLLCGTAFSAGRVECRALASQVLGRAVRYCVALPPSYDSNATRRYPVLYYLHGLGDNEQTLLHRGGWNLVEQLHEEGRIGEFLIATPDGGRSFYVNARDGGDRYEEFFVKEFLPGIERRYRAVGSRAARGIGGTSMGGYGALRFAFQHPEMFVSASAHSAALVEELPNALADAFGRGLGAFGDPADAAYWRKNTPFALARPAARLKGLKIYFDCGDQDEYGFDQGAQEFHNLLQQLGVPHEFHIFPGDHSWEFVAEHFDESLEFHSRAFQAAQ